MPSFRDKKSFGERIEYQVTARMLMEGMDCYKPLIDDHGVDLVIKQKSGQYIEVQIKARSKDVQAKNSAFFAAIDHEFSPNYFFIFYSETLDTTWLLSSGDFIENSIKNESGKNAGKRSIKLNGVRKGKAVVLDKFEKFIVKDFASHLDHDPNEKNVPNKG